MCHHTYRRSSAAPIHTYTYTSLGTLFIRPLLHCSSSLPHPAHLLLFFVFVFQCSRLGIDTILALTCCDDLDAAVHRILKAVVLRSVLSSSCSNVYLDSIIPTCKIWKVNHSQCCFGMAPGHKIHLFVSFSPIPHQYLVTSWTLSLKLLSCFRLVCTYWLDYSSIHIHFLGSSPRMYKWWNYFFSQWEQSMRRSPDICYTGLIHCAFCIRSLPDLQDSGLLVYRDTLIIEDINDFKTMLDPAQKNIQIPWSAEPPPWHHYFSVLFLPSTLGLPLYSKVKHVIDR